ncbi:MAG: SEC-C domain-containing protein [Candidatus Omnitrophica bacterium]|nr:SEC-C domain-containing protein [Candidatus Omnitrophota bacterium]
MTIKLKKEDCSDISIYFPELNYEENHQRIWGTLNFICCYNEKKGELEFKDDENSITDLYEIEIDFNKSHLRLPKVYERSEKIINYAKDQNIKLLDLHMFKDGSCCLGIYPEDACISAFEFLVRRVVPYFFWQSYYRLKGKEPWKAYAHGKNGYIEKDKELTETISSCEDTLSWNIYSGMGNVRNCKCPCESGKKYKKCCMANDDVLRSKISNLKQAQSSVKTWIEKAKNKKGDIKEMTD